MVVMVVKCPTCVHRHAGIGAWGPCLWCLKTKPFYTWPNFEEGPCEFKKAGQRCSRCPDSSKNKKESEHQEVEE